MMMTEKVQLPSRSLLMLAVVFILELLFSEACADTPSRGQGQALRDVALEELEAGVSRNPQDVEAHLSLAMGHASRGQNEKAIAHFRLALEMQGDVQLAHFGLGLLHLRQGELDPALEHLMRVVEMDQKSPSSPRAEHLETVYYSVGVIHVQKADYPQAIHYLKLALALNPVDADAWCLLGWAQHRAGEMEAALVSYRQTVRLVPNFVEAYRGMEAVYTRLGREGERRYALGMIHLAGGSSERAAQELEMAAREVPSMAEVHLGLGLAREVQGRLAEALGSYRRAAELDPGLLLAEMGARRLEERLQRPPGVPALLERGL